MAITSSDVKLMKSSVLLDTPDGGGAMSGTEIVDGLSNNLFPDISELDYAYGRVNLRKGFLSIRNAGTDSYYGSHMIIDSPPAEPLVAVTLFTREDWFDERSQAQDYIENYIVKSAPYSGYLMGDQVQGARSIIFLQREETALPRIGDVLYIWQDGLGEQYVRVTDIESEMRTYTVPGGSGYIDIQRRWVRCTIASALEYTFVGNAPNIIDSPGPAKLYTTQVANSARYYGVKPLAQAATTGSMSLKVNGIFTSLVPSAQVETPFVDVQLGDTCAPVISCGPSAVTQSISATVVNGLVIYCSMGAARNSISITGGGYTWIDDGAGNLVRNSLVEGTVDYASGKIAFVNPAVNPSSLTLSFRPAVAPNAIAWSKAQDVTIGSRGYNWVATLSPVPVAGSVLFDYMAQGNWYRLRDDGKGHLIGDGSGAIDYATGSVIATCAALPDVDTQVIFSWGQKLEYRDLSAIQAIITIQPPQVRFTLSNAGVPGTLTISWISDGVTKTAADDGHGHFSGDATGTVDYATGEVVLQPGYIHDAGAMYHASWTQDFPYLMDLPGATFTLPNVPVRPYSVRIDAQYERFNVILRDNGSGSLLADAQEINDGAVRYRFTGGAAGTINYATGEVSLSSVTITTETILYSVSAGDYVVTPWTTYGVTPSFGTVYYSKDTTQSTTLTQDIAGPPVTTQLISYAGMSSVVPGSVCFSWRGYRYVDRNGSLFHSVDPLTNTGVFAGTISYGDGLITLTDWGVSGGVNTLSMSSLLSILVRQQIVSCVFRLPGAPIRPGSFYIQVNLAADNSIVSATADLSGVISSAHISGSINYATGVVSVRFGHTVSSVWYDDPVFADSMRYNCIVYSYIPLDSSIIGMDPTRLPSDGRVPIFRSGDIVVVHNEQTTAFPSNAGAGYVLNTGRVRLESAYVIDANGLKFPTDKYSVNLDAGTVTLLTSDFTGYTLPLSCIHRIEDMALVSDVQISGYLTLTRALSHDFPLDSYVSSALIFGDLQADVHNVFSQQTWTSVWSDELIGSGTTSQYNTAVYPITTSNLGAVEERWALIFTSSTQFRVVGEHVGQIAVGDINTDCAPLNPTNGTPYFTVLAAGWGSGWAVGNVLRFNTSGAGAPVWVARTILQGTPSVQSDVFRLQARGDIDRP